MLWPNNSYPFLKPDSREGGGLGTPPAVDPNAVPQANVGSKPSSHPMDSEPGSVLDDGDESLLGDVGRGSGEDTPRGKESSSARTSFFDDEFDSSALEAPLRGQYEKMKAEFESRTSGLPDRDALEAFTQKSQAFDKLVMMPEFQEWAAKMTGEEAPRSAGQKAAAEAGLEALDSLDEETRNAIGTYIQQTVDKHVSEKVTPLSEAFYAREADASLAKIKQAYGEDTFSRLADRAADLMERTSGLTADQAFQLAHYDELKSQRAQDSQRETQDKFLANMEGQGSFGTEPAASQATDARSAIEQALEAVKAGRGFNPRSLPEGYRGEVG